MAAERQAIYGGIVQIPIIEMVETLMKIMEDIAEGTMDIVVRIMIQTAMEGEIMTVIVDETIVVITDENIIGTANVIMDVMTGTIHVMKVTAVGLIVLEVLQVHRKLDGILIAAIIG